MSKYQRLILDIMGTLCVGLSIGASLHMSNIEQISLVCGIYWLASQRG